MQEVQKFQLLTSISLASKVADFLYFTRTSSDTTSQEVVFLASREGRVNHVIERGSGAFTEVSKANTGLSKVMAPSTH